MKQIHFRVITPGEGPVYVCGGCGAMVVDTEAHVEMHEKIEGDR